VCVSEATRAALSQLEAACGVESPPTEDLKADSLADPAPLNSLGQLEAASERGARLSNRLAEQKASVGVHGFHRPAAGPLERIPFSPGYARALVRCLSALSGLPRRLDSRADAAAGEPSPSRLPAIHGAHLFARLFACARELLARVAVAKPRALHAPV
jgi:hypothetical protein